MNDLLLSKELTPETAKLLISAGADINYKNKDDYTPLKSACYNKNYDLVKFLIENGADKNIYWEINYWTTTEEINMYLVQSGCRSSKKSIIKYGTEEQKSKIVVTFEEACESFEYTKFYIDQGGDINKQCEYYSNTLLHYAVKKKDLEWVKYLVDKGADKKIKCSCGEVPARIYHYDAPIEIYEILNENINEPDIDGNTLLHDCIKHNNNIMIDYLTSIGAKYDIKNKEGITAYDLAKDKTIFKTKEELIKDLVGKNIKWAIETLIKDI